MPGRHVAAPSEEAALGHAPLARDAGGLLVFVRRPSALASAIRLVLHTARNEVSRVFWTDTTDAELVQEQSRTVSNVPEAPLLVPLALHSWKTLDGGCDTAYCSAPSGFAHRLCVHGRVWRAVGASALLLLQGLPGRQCRGDAHELSSRGGDQCGRCAARVA